MNWAQLQHETLILVAWRPCESQEHRRQHPPESKTGSMHYIKRETLVAASQHHDRNSVEKLPSRCPACEEDLLLLPLNGVALSGGSCLSDVNRPALCLLALLLGDVEEALCHFSDVVDLQVRTAHVWPSPASKSLELVFFASKYIGGSFQAQQPSILKVHGCHSKEAKGGTTNRAQTTRC